MKSVWKAHLAAFLANVIYGANYSIAKEVMPRFFQPFGLIVFRVSGAILLFALLFWGKTERFQKKDIPRFALCGLLGVACNQLLFFKGFMALSTYRVSHQLWKDGRRWLALYLQSISSEVFSTDIHPAATIGCGILLDHATSFVVGETAIIEDDVSILHEVTLGGTGKATGARHPIIRSGVLIGAGAKILGRVEIGTHAKVGAGSVVLNDVPPHTTVAGVPAVIVGEARELNPAMEMNQKLDCRGADI